MTIVRTAILASVGYDPAVSTERVGITTASGVEFAARIVADRIESLGLDRREFPILAYTLPPSATVDGLLGLDFLRDGRVLIDFREGVVEIT